MVTALTYKDSDPSLLVNWALEFLIEKGHRVGESFLNADRVVVVTVDTKIMRVAESGDIVNLTAGYADWPHRVAQFGDWLQEHSRTRAKSKN